MPHDKNGNPLKAGDKVIIRATISTISEGAEYCNLSLSTDEPMYPGDSRTGLNLNAKQVELATPPAEAAPTLPPEQPLPQEVIDAAAKQPGGA